VGRFDPVFLLPGAPPWSGGVSRKAVADHLSANFLPETNRSDVLTPSN
jgi:hypothetical protein